jgi:predicted  nucleic acid-binding Zn-ribbon protein
MSEAGATAKYGIDLEVDNSEAIAQAANAFKDLKAQIDADTKALSTMQKALRALKKDTSVNVEQVDKLRAAIAGKKKAIGEAASQRR